MCTTLFIYGSGQPYECDILRKDRSSCQDRMRTEFTNARFLFFLKFLSLVIGYYATSQGHKPRGTQQRNIGSIYTVRQYLVTVVTVVTVVTIVTMVTVVTVITLVTVVTVVTAVTMVKMVTVVTAGRLAEWLLTGLGQPQIEP